MIPAFPIAAKELLPQRPPFLFVDRLLSYDGEEVRTAFTVPQEGILIENGHLQASGLLEHMAQSSAARVGFISKYVLEIPIRIGFIGAIRSGKIYRLPLAGETIETTISSVREIGGVTMVDAIVRSGDEIIAEANLKSAMGQEAQQ